MGHRSVGGSLANGLVQRSLDGRMGRWMMRRVYPPHFKNKATLTWLIICEMENQTRYFFKVISSSDIPGLESP